jgi:hypothetical protein
LWHALIWNQPEWYWPEWDWRQRQFVSVGASICCNIIAYHDLALLAVHAALAMMASPMMALQDRWQGQILQPRFAPLSWGLPSIHAFINRSFDVFALSDGHYPRSC